MEDNFNDSSMTPGSSFNFNDTPAGHCSNFNDYPVGPFNKWRAPMVFVGDSSGSMSRMSNGIKAIDSLNSGLRQFRNDLLGKDGSDCIEAALISFNETVELVQDWCSLEAFNPPHLTPDGGTDIEAALEYAIQYTIDHAHDSKRNGIEEKVPQIVLITDGKSASLSNISSKIKQLTAQKKLALWVLAVGDYNHDTLNELTDGGKRLVELDKGDYDMSNFFKILAISTRAVSVSAPGTTAVIPNNDTLNSWLKDIT